MTKMRNGQALLAAAGLAALLAACGGKAETYVNSDIGVKLDLLADNKALLTKADGSTMEATYTAERDANGAVRRVMLGVGGDTVRLRWDEDDGCLDPSDGPGKFCPA